MTMSQMTGGNIPGGRMVALWPAYAQAMACLCMLVVALFIIGPRGIGDPGVVESLARTNPWPIVVQDALKLLSVCCLALLVRRWRFLNAERTVEVPLVCRLSVGLSLLLLVVNAAMSLAATAGWLPPEHMGVVRAAIGLSGALSLVLAAPWYLAIAWLGWRQSLLPKGVAALGFVIALCNLSLVLGLVALILSILWFPLMAISLRRRGLSA